MDHSFIWKLLVKNIITIVMLAIVAGCSKSGSGIQTGTVAAKLNWSSASKSVSKTVAAAPVGVATVRTIVTGTGITPALQKDFAAGAGAGVIDGVIAGTGRTLAVQGLDTSGTLVYQGATVNLTVVAGQTTDAGTITMLPVSSSVSSISEVLLPGGDFQMGDHYNFVDPAHPSDEIPIHAVSVSSFYVAVTVATNKQFLDFLNSSISQNLIEVRSNAVYAVGGTDIYCYLYNYQYQTGKYATAYSIGFDSGMKTFAIKDSRTNHPMVGVTWIGAAAYSNWLSRQAGLQECFNLSTGVCDFTKNGYRLPTEAEWEYAARGGQYSPYYDYPWGNDPDILRANWPGSGNPYQGTDTGTYPWTTPVGFFDGSLRTKSDYNWPGSVSSFQTHNGANAFGLNDMAGNVWQLVYDWYDAGYYKACADSGACVNPRGPASGQLMTDGKPYHGMRGGSWFNGEIVSGVNNGHSRVSNRCPAAPEFFAVPQWGFSSNVGFRVARNAAGSSGGSLAASFSYSPNIPLNGLALSFSDTSTGNPTMWLWDFGDQKGISRLQNPKYIYTIAGSYSVKLTVGTASGSSGTFTRNVTVGASTDALSAAFTYGVNSRTVTFTGTSSGAPRTFSWDFGDGTTSTLQNPVHTYAGDDIYTVRLTAANSNGTSDYTQSVIVNSTVTRTVGLMKNTSNAFAGYTLFAPKQSRGTYLINNDGRVVHKWSKSSYSPGQSVYLLENGHLLHTCVITSGGLSSGGGEGGRIEEYDWDDNLVWYLNWSTDTYRQHHDVKMLPNGNIIMLVVEKKTLAEVTAAGFDTTKFQPDVTTVGMLLPDSIIEIKPDYVSGFGGTVVWEWHVWDHLIQNFNSSKVNYGVPSAHPELMQAIGGPMFWNHMNSIDYHPVFDQIAVSVRNMSEVWIIDHSTTTAQAAGHTGGARGKGGDIIYRWGNAGMYGVSTSQSSRMYFQQHDAEWIKSDCPGAGNITVFDNDLQRSTTNASSVEEFTPAVDASGNYASVTSGSAFGPSVYTWNYWGDTNNPMYSENISGAQRLQNGNTIICSGGTGEFREVTYSGDVVWKYVNPIQPAGIITQGTTPASDTTHPGETLNSVFRIYKYPLDYAAFKGRTITPGDYIVK